MTLEVSDGHGNDSEVVDDCGRKKTKEALEVSGGGGGGGGGVGGGGVKGINFF
ncbi:hypothetical protein E2C01_097676 [Portunus trituberculatus]|uniref:Uncharacterized protein n=1 Tax=Portunus trituberculatus TaxID=210409 RepID=A0A5B7K6B3_PORTR|nr:hypothetical protein [Portunus trituberculatus]